MRQGNGEFIALMALMISLVALSIDAMLPALGQIAADLNVSDANDRQLVVTVLFLGLAVGQLVYGPVSDSVGRKPPIYAGFYHFYARLFDFHFCDNLCSHVGRSIFAGSWSGGSAYCHHRPGAGSIRRQRHGENHVIDYGRIYFGSRCCASAWTRDFAGCTLADYLCRFLCPCGDSTCMVCGSTIGNAFNTKSRPFSISQLSSAFYETCTNRLAVCYTIAPG